jgi:hypothetical protein
MKKNQTLKNITKQLVTLKEPDQDAVQEYFNELLEKAKAMKGCIRVGTCKVWTDSCDEPSNELTLTADIQGNLARDSAFESLSEKDQFRALENAIFAICTYIEDQEDPNLKALACAELQLLGVEFIPIRNRLCDNGTPNAIFENAQKSFSLASREILEGMHPVCHALLMSVTVPWDSVFCERELHYEIAFAFADQCPADRLDIKTLETISIVLSEEHSDHDKVKACVLRCFARTPLSSQCPGLFEVIREPSETGFTLNSKGLVLALVNQGDIIDGIPIGANKIKLGMVHCVDVDRDFKDEDSIEPNIEAFKILCGQLANSEVEQPFKFKVPCHAAFLTAIADTPDLKGCVSCISFDLEDFTMNDNADRSILCDQSETYALSKSGHPGLEIETEDYSCFLNIKEEALERFFAKEFSLFVDVDNDKHIHAVENKLTEDELIIEILSKRSIDFNSFIDILSSKLPQSALQESEAEFRIRVYNKVQELVTEGKVKKDGKKYKVKK